MLETCKESNKQNFKLFLLTYYNMRQEVLINKRKCKKKQNLTSENTKNLR